MSDSRWSDETERVTADAMLAELNAWDGEPDDRLIGMAVARAALSALADAGLLVPANSTAAEEWAYPVGPPDAPRMIATWLRDPVIPGISKRTVITTPWAVVPAPTLGGVE